MHRLTKLIALRLDGKWRLMEDTLIEDIADDEDDDRSVVGWEIEEVIHRV